MTDHPIEIAVAAGSQVPANPLLHGPILRTLLRLAVPNMISMTASVLVVIAETIYVGMLGIEQLAAIALAFPFVVLMQMMSAGAMGGGVSSAIARALGADDDDRAATLAIHAVLIGLCGGALYSIVMLGFGRHIFSVIGGRDRVLSEALAYSNVVFCGAIGVWLANTLVSILRGSGNMKIPSFTLICAAVTQIVVGGTLGLGLFGVPRFGMAGVACGQLAGFGGATIFLAWYLLSGRSRVKLRLRRVALQRALFIDILKVGAVACLSSLQSVTTVLIFTWLLSPYGTTMLAGYGIGARLEFMLIPMASAVGVASVPMVGMNIGAGQIARARQIAWTAGWVAGIVIGMVGIILAVWPDLWAARFTENADVLEVARTYLRMAGPGFGFLGFATCLYFASQGSGKIIGPVLGQTGRLVVVAFGGALLAAVAAPGWTLFLLAAISMVIYAGLVILSVRLTDWTQPALRQATT